MRTTIYSNYKASRKTDDVLITITDDDGEEMYISSQWGFLCKDKSNALVFADVSQRQIYTRLKKFSDQHEGKQAAALYLTEPEGPHNKAYNTIKK